MTLDARDQHYLSEVVAVGNPMELTHQTLGWRWLNKPLKGTHEGRDFVQVIDTYVSPNGRELVVKLATGHRVGVRLDPEYPYKDHGRIDSSLNLFLTSEQAPPRAVRKGIVVGERIVTDRTRRYLFDYKLRPLGRSPVTLTFGAYRVSETGLLVPEGKQRDLREETKQLSISPPLITPKSCENWAAAVDELGKRAVPHAPNPKSNILTFKPRPT